MTDTDPAIAAEPAVVDVEPPAAEFVQPTIEAEVQELAPDDNGDMVVTQVRRVYAVDEGENGTWRDAITIPADEYETHSAKGTLDEFAQAQIDERYQAVVDARNAPPPEVVPPTPEELAQLVTDKRLQIIGLGEEYAGITSRYVQLVRELLDLDDTGAIPPLPVPTALTPPELEALKQEAAVREQIAAVDAQIAEAGSVAP